MQAIERDWLFIQLFLAVVEQTLIFGLATALVRPLDPNT
jgi:hypothetical protein